MKKRSTFDWILIGLLAVLLAVAGAGFVYLFTQYQSSATPEHRWPAPTAGCHDGEPCTPWSRQPRPFPHAHHPASSPPNGPPPTDMVSPTGSTVDLPSRELSGSPTQPLPFRPPASRDTHPIWPLNELRYGSGTNFSSRSGIHTGLDLLTDYRHTGLRHRCR